MRRSGRAILATGWALLLAGCMTAYQPYGITGGYKEVKLADDTYQVSFYGNGNTPRGAVLKYFLYRCAELTLEHGYTYFELYSTERKQSLDDDPFVKVRGGSSVPTYTYVPSVTISTWSAVGIVRMYPKDVLMDSPTFFAARDVIAMLGPEVRSGTPGANVPAKFRGVEGKFPVMQVGRAPAAEPPPTAPPTNGGPVNLDDLKGLMPAK